MIHRKIVLSLLALVSLLLHFIGLDHPNSVVFDEVHFGSFAQAYCCTGEYFFDIHPPTGKLIIAGAAKLLGATGMEDFSSIGQTYTQGSALAYRFAPALAGSLLPLAVMLLLWQLGASFSASFLGGLFVLFDNALLVQTRIIAIDGLLLLFILLTISSGLHALEKIQQGQIKKILLAFSVCGVFACLSVSIKLTGLVATGLIGIMGLWDISRKLANIRFWLLGAICFIASAAIIYLISWYLHFALLTEAGPGDEWGRPTGKFIADFLKIHQQMLSANTGLAASHPAASPWWSWPLMLKPIFYWVSEDNWIYLLGNPIVWWLSTLFFALALLNLLLAKISNVRSLEPGFFSAKKMWLPLLAYMAAFVPLIAVSRVLFLYHYFTALVFSLVFFMLWLDGIGFTRGDKLLEQRVSYYGFITILIIGFILITPVSFGVMGGSASKAWLFSTFPHWR